MRHFMLLVGMGTALVATDACRATPGTPLAAAAAGDDLAEVRRLLMDGHAPDESDGPGLTPLMWAARNGAVHAMAVLLDAGANPDAFDARNEWTPLQHAIHKRQRAAVLLLLDRGADPNTTSAPGRLTPLLMAAGDPDPTVVEALLARGANARYEGEWGDTPLGRAVSGGALSDIDRPLLGGCRTATVRALLAHDPTLRLPNTIAAREALWWARFHRCEEVLQLVANAESPQRTLRTQSELP